MKKAKNKKVNHRVCNYTAIFEPAEEGGYVVYVPAIPGCVTQGETFEEAEEMAKDAIEGCLQTLKDLKEEVPIESTSTIVTRIPVSV